MPKSHKALDIFRSSGHVMTRYDDTWGGPFFYDDTWGGPGWQQWEQLEGVRAAIEGRQTWPQLREAQDWPGKCQQLTNKRATNWNQNNFKKKWPTVETKSKLANNKNQTILNAIWTILNLGPLWAEDLFQTSDTAIFLSRATSLGVMGEAWRAVAKILKTTWDYELAKLISYVWIGKYKRIGEDGGGVRGGGKNGDKHLTISFYIFIWCLIVNSVT